MKKEEKKFTWVVYGTEEDKKAGKKVDEKGVLLASDGTKVKVEKKVDVQIATVDADFAILYPKLEERLTIFNRGHLIEARSVSTPTECVKPGTSLTPQEKATGKALGGAMTDWPEPDRLAMQAALAKGDFGTAGDLLKKHAPKPAPKK